MPLITRSIPNLIGGVSQQPEVLRLQNQGSEQENGFSGVVEGLKKRPPTSGRPPAKTHKRGPQAKMAVSKADRSKAVSRTKNVIGFSDLKPKSPMKGKKAACYYKVKGRGDVWPSAYESGQLVQCRKAGAANWGTKSKK